MSSTNRRDKEPGENRFKEGSSKVPSPSSPNSHKGRGKESSGFSSPRPLSKPENGLLHSMKDGISADDRRQNKNASLYTSSKAIRKRIPQIKDINIPLAQSSMGDHKEGSGSSGSTSAGSRSTGKTSGSENFVSDPGSTRPTTPTRSPRGSQVNSPSRAPVSASTSSTPESVTRAISRLAPTDPRALSSKTTAKCPIICSANRFETSVVASLTIYRIGFFPITPPREQCPTFIQKLHESPNLQCLNKGYASDYTSSLLTIGDIQDATREPLILPMPNPEKNSGGTAKPPSCHLLILRVTSIPIERFLK